MSQIREGYAKEGAYVGFAGMLDFTLDGITFDGTTVYKEVGGEELGFLPRLDTRNMLRTILGFRAPQFALEFSYERTRHEGDFRGFNLPGVFQAINVDGRVFFLTTRRLQPHVVVGLAFPWLTIEDGGASNDTANALIGDVLWRGQGLNGEAGVTAFLTRRVGVGIGYNFRVIWFNRARGVSNTVFKLEPRFRETSSSVIVTGFFTF